MESFADRLKPLGLAADFGNVYSPYGFKVVEFNGKKTWGIATLNDYRSAEARRLGIAEAEVAEPHYNCGLTNGGCIGNCGGVAGVSCKEGIDIFNGQVYCYCS